MERNRISSFHRQLSRVYSLLILHIIISIIGLILNYVGQNNNTLYFSIIFFNIIALFLFEPWKIMGYLNKGYEYKQRLEMLLARKKDA